MLRYSRSRNEEVGSQNHKVDLMVISGIRGDLIKLRLAIASVHRQRNKYSLQMSLQGQDCCHRTELGVLNFEQNSASFMSLAIFVLRKPVTGYR